MRFLSVILAMTLYNAIMAQTTTSSETTALYANSQSYALYYLSGDGQIGVINQQTPLPLQVRIVDQAAQPVTGYPVVFTVMNGGGHLDGALEMTLFTNTNGIAAITPTLGNTVGNYNNIFRAQAFNQYGGQLTGSPVEFRISARKSAAKKISAVSGNYQSAQANDYLPQPLVVRIVDADNMPIAGHDVVFQVIQGSGTLGTEGKTSVTRISNGNGIAEVDFKLGMEIGNNNHVVRVQADDGIAPLEQSPLYFYASAPYGIPHPQLSKIYVPAKITADGLDEARITIELRDNANNPVPGERVTLTVSGTKNGLVQPENQTNNNGQTIARLRSTKAEKKVIRARVSNHDIWLDQTATIEFISGLPDHFTKISGDEQTGSMNQQLDEQLVICLADFFENPIIGADIFFIPDPGCGSILQNLPVVTDTLGYARANWVLGNTIGRQVVIVSTPDLNLPVQFSANVSMPREMQLVKTSGDDQFAAPGTLFPDSLKVVVQHRENRPTAGILVKFELLQGDATLSATGFTSDAFGRAGIRITAGILTGTVKVRASINDTVFTDFLCAVANGKPDRIIHIYGSGLLHTVGDTIPLLAVQVLDETLNPVANVPITFQSDTQGGKILDADVVRSNNIGQASVKAQVGIKPGFYYFSALNDDLVGSPIIFKIGVNPGPAQSMVILDGNNQSGKPESLLPQPLRIQITDKFTNGIINAPVIFSTSSGDGEIIESQPVTTDSFGIAYSHWRLGPEGTQTVNVITTVLPNIALQFFASLEANLPPLIDAPDDTVVVEGQELQFTITASDPEGDIVSITASDLPDGAVFDSLTTFFSWTPALNQQGDYAVTFIARDQHDRFSQKIVYIHVIDKNRPPEFYKLYPDEPMMSAYYFQPIRFTAQAEDPDGESLRTVWYLNNIEVGHDTVFQFIPSLNTPISSHVLVLVTDKKDTITHSWDINLLPLQAQLTTLRAEQEQDYVLLTWTPEDDVYGYYVQKSSNLGCPFIRITQKALTQIGRYKDACTDMNKVIYYRLEKILKSGVSIYTEPVEIKCVIPAADRIFQNYPNPFNAGTTISFEIHTATQIDLTIYNISGTMVCRLYSGTVCSGHHSVFWDGNNENGHTVPTGVYYGVLTSNNWRKMLKLLYIK
ncbi:Ig-like domain-containing protein [candidate division KSB1 bacterium]|nr:Ig-like domain-containing protein [candidate division KSB1 bacterium]